MSIDIEGPGRVPLDATQSVSTPRPGDVLRMAAARLVDSSRISLLFKLGVSVGLIILVCRHVDGAVLVDALRHQSAAWLAATTLLGLVQIGLLSWRWQQIVQALGGETSTVSALSVTFMGCFFGAFLLGPTGGDVARAVLAPTRSLGRRGIVHSVLFERLTSVIGLGLAALPLVVLNAGPLARSAPLAVTLAVVPLAFLAAATAARLARWLGDRNRALLFALRDLDQSWRLLLCRWRRFALAVAVATVGQGLVAVEAWCLAQGQHLGVPLVDFAILMPPVMLVVALPISAGGWGLREGAIVAALGLVGVAPALLLSVEFGLIGTLISLPGGAIWLRRCFLRVNQNARDT
ncbi:MAG: lysylphosphatidylglycerol synthase transmembrane domain-containing protein [Stellaceae bacterium]